MSSLENKKKIRAIYRGLVSERTRNKVFRWFPISLQNRLNVIDRELKMLPPEIHELNLPQEKIGPSRFSRRINKLCSEDDWRDEAWLGLFDALGEGKKRTKKHRKAWEWVQGVYALGQLNLLHDGATALGVGAGVESVLYFLANQIKQVVATDIYGQGDFVNHEAPADMLLDAAKYAKFPYRADHLQTKYMNALQLDFADNHFDFAFSFSSIEHFGGHEAAHQALREMARVVKPGGAVVLTTEVVLNGLVDEEYFLPEEVGQYLLSVPRLRPIEDIDYSMDEKTFAGFVDTAKADYIDQLPHLVLKRGLMYYTSLSLVMQVEQIA